jgi:hypothetical protein
MQTFYYVHKVVHSQYSGKKINVWTYILIIIPSLKAGINEITLFTQMQDNSNPRWPPDKTHLPTENLFIQIQMTPQE